ncbi:MAG TPA: hypothetical protein VGH91_07590 [Gammaproteobacteria bacterium]
MRGLIRLLFGIFAVMVLLGASNCTQTSNSDAPQFVTTLQVENSGVPSSSFAQGDTISLVLTIRNRTDGPLSLYFNSSEFANFAAVNAGTATVVWTCDGDTSTVTAATCADTANPTVASTGTSTSGGSFVQINFTAFQTQTVTFTWTSLDNDGNDLAVGDYEVFGGFTVYNATGPGDAADNGSSMAEGPPTAKQMFPTVYVSTLVPFSITTPVTE